MALHPQLGVPLHNTSIFEDLRCLSKSTTAADKRTSSSGVTKSTAAVALKSVKPGDVFLPGRPATEKPKRAAPNKMLFTNARLDEYLSKRPHEQEVVWDEKEDGLCVLVSRGPKGKRSGTVTFRVVYYLEPGKPSYLKLGRYGVVGPEGTYVYPYKDENDEPIEISCSNLQDVRDAARDIRNRARRGIDPERSVASDAFHAVVKDFIDLHAKKYRSWKEAERILNTYVVPEWQGLKIGDITRRDHVTPLLDSIERQRGGKHNPLGGKLVADTVLVQLNTLFNWHCIRDQIFVSPLVKGMRRGPSSRLRARKRVLSTKNCGHCGRRVTSSALMARASNACC